MYYECIITIKWGYLFILRIKIVDFNNSFICSNIPSILDWKRKIEILVSLLKFVKIFFIQIYIKFADKQLTWLIWNSYIDWGYYVSDNESCPILKMMCSVIGLLTLKKRNHLFVYNTSDKQWCKPLSDFQDVMLSATSTQSPLATVSSVFTMPNISMPTVSLANSGGLGGLTDHLFMSHIPADPPNAHSNSVTDTHTDKSGTWNFEFQKKINKKFNSYIFTF